LGFGWGGSYAPPLYTTEPLGCSDSLEFGGAGDRTSENSAYIVTVLTDRPVNLLTLPSSESRLSVYYAGPCTTSPTSHPQDRIVAWTNIVPFHVLGATRGRRNIRPNNCYWADTQICEWAVRIIRKLQKSARTPTSPSVVPRSLLLGNHLQHILSTQFR